MPNRAKSRQIVVWLMCASYTFAYGQFSTGGSAAVSPSGAAEYRIPIQVPPGVSGMEPKLALAYSSQAGLGVAGWGWGLDGVSAITRCPRTMAQDGVRGTIGFDANDRFCLDGQRLMVVSGAYGASGSEYRTEMESFSKIVAYGSSNPSNFLIKTKAGLTMEYGNTADSRIEAQGKAAVRVWALNKVTDVKGNYYTLSYTEDNANGDFRLTRIDYTGNAGQAPVNSVQLGYESRPDSYVRYVGGAKVKMVMRLSNVSTYVGANKVKEYRLTYLTQTHASDKSRLANVQECDAVGACLLPTLIQWANESLPQTVWQSEPNLAPPHPLMYDGYKNSGYEMMDVNGDGRPDLLVGAMITGIDVLGVTNRRTTWLNTAAGWVTSTAYTSPVLFKSVNDSYPYRGVRFADLNADGKPDIMYSVGYRPTTTDPGTLYRQTWLGTERGWGASGGEGSVNYLAPVHINRHDPQLISVPTMSPYYPYDPADASLADLNYLPSDSADSGVRLVDLNGDGLPDFVRAIKKSALTGYEQVLRTWLNNGVGGWVETPGYALPVPLVVAGVNDPGVQLIDVNGDGLVDVVKARSSGGVLTSKTWLNTGSGFVEVPAYALPYALAYDDLYDSGARLIDLNGDGLPDFVYARAGQTRVVLLNTGAGWVDGRVGFSFPGGVYQLNPAAFQFPTNLIDTSVSDTGVRLLDVNGDGLPDVIYSKSNAGVVSNDIWLNTGSTWSQATNNYWAPTPIALDSPADSGVRFEDIDGDGRVDLIHQRCMVGQRLGYNGSPLLGNIIPCDSSRAGAYLNKNPLNVVTKISPNGVLSSTSGAFAGVVFEYDSLTNAQVYTKDTGAESYPRLNLQVPMLAVTKLSKANGLGGLNATNYTYGGLKAEIGAGRGSLGFRWTRALEQVTGIELYTEYNQTWPYIGMPIKSETRMTGAGNGGLLKQSTTTMACKVPMTAAACSVAPGNQYFIYASSTAESSWDLNGAAMPTITTANQYGINPGDTQMWGDPSQVDVVTTHGGQTASKVTVNQYWPADVSAGKWITGRLKKATVTSTLNQ
jgi:hypothetical protein